jgi:peptide/nickel transport system substrate-binding protein
MARGAPAAAAVAALLFSAGPSRSAQKAADATRTSVLTASPGPRGSDWKRAFNPFRDDTDTRWPATCGVYEPLVVYSRATRTYLPWLATAYKWGAGNTSLRFTLRSGVVWSDGTPFSSGDVAFTFGLMRRFPALDRQQVWSFLSEVKAVEPSTVDFVFKQAYTPGFLAVGTQPIVAEHRWKDVANPAAFDDPSPVGTGPFVEVRRFEPTVYELGRNPRYWQNGKPAVDVLRVALFRSNEESLRALNEGTLDWASLFLDDVEARWAAKDPARHLYWYPDFGQTVLLHVNTQRKPFDDARVRQAVSLALDRPRIMREALNNYTTPADATGLAESQQVWKDPAVVRSATWTRRDVAQANKLLDAAGLARGANGTRALPGGGPLSYDLNLVAGWSDWVIAASIIRENLAEVGIEVTVKPLLYDAWFGALERGRFDLGLWFGDRGPTPYEFYRSQLDPRVVRPAGEKAITNFHRFGHEEAGRLLREFEATADEREMKQVSSALQKIYVEQAPSLPLYSSPLWGVFNATRVTGFPSRFHPYAGASPGQHSDVLQVLTEVKPR